MVYLVIVLLPSLFFIILSWLSTVSNCICCHTMHFLLRVSFPQLYLLMFNPCCIVIAILYLSRSTPMISVYTCQSLKAVKPVIIIYCIVHEMPRRARVQFSSLHSSLVNLPISIYGPLLERGVVSLPNSNAVQFSLFTSDHSIWLFIFLLCRIMVSSKIPKDGQRRTLGGPAWPLRLHWPIFTLARGGLRL